MYKIHPTSFLESFLKNIICVLVLFLISVPGLTADLKTSQVILKEIEKNMIKDFDLQATPDNSGDINYPKHPIGKKLSKGALKIQEMLRKNREKIKRRQAQKTQQKRPSDNWMDQKQSDKRKWTQNKMAQQRRMEDKYAAQIRRWEAEKLNYYKKIPVYKKNLVTFKEEKKVVQNFLKISPKEILPQAKMVEKALDTPTLDQGKRPTCSSFAAVAAIEIMLRKKGINKKLSPQYIYYSSKPKCQQQKCQKRGAWVETAFKYSSQQVAANIPTLADCPYNAINDKNNQTQIPLVAGCQRGKVKITRYTKVKTAADIIRELKRDYPVIGAFKLSKSFYKNRGYVFLKDADTLGEDAHAKGHALLLVGIMQLPPKLHTSEGKFCLMAKNSWGPGWGIGGFSCLSAKWIEKYRYNVPFIALNEIR